MKKKFLLLTLMMMAAPAFGAPAGSPWTVATCRAARDRWQESLSQDRKQLQTTDLVSRAMAMDRCAREVDRGPSLEALSRMTIAEVDKNMANMLPYTFLSSVYWERAYNSLLDMVLEREHLK